MSSSTHSLYIFALFILGCSILTTSSAISLMISAEAWIFMIYIYITMMSSIEITDIVTVLITLMVCDSVYFLTLLISMIGMTKNSDLSVNFIMKWE
uniref:NADH dehydrogenase subunit 4L n=1 Tax=Plegadiphilus threskiornis TaxID=2965265 RepID=UPI0026E492E5|nr:NADH dehydrogenase subunit 4L [Plegadiphilus threskiornis]WIM51526.1 NADH dehydrogenase subunit 4L [Plegadiphilus threskiornis]